MPQSIAQLPSMTEDATWRAIDPRDRHRIPCDHVGMCGRDAVWATRANNIYVCDYHRFVLEVQRVIETLMPSKEDWFEKYTA